MLYRFAIIPGTRRAILRLRDQDGWMTSRPDWGRGRIDPFNPVKFGILRQPVDETIGNSDMMPLWNQARRDGTAYHWDGLSTSLREVVQSSALGDGASRRMGGPRLREVERDRPEADVEPAARDELHRLDCRRRSIRCQSTQTLAAAGGTVLQGALRRVPRAGRQRGPGR